MKLTKKMITGNSFFSTQMADGTYVGTIDRMNILMNSGCDDKNKCCLFYSTQFKADTMIYIDDVRFVKTVEVAESEGVTGSEIALSATADGIDCAFAYTVIDPEGNAVAVENGKFTPMMTGEYQVTATISDHVRAGGSGTGKINVMSTYSIDAAKPYVALLTGERVDIPAARIVDEDGKVVNGDLSATVNYAGKTVTVENNSFLADAAGDYEIIYKAVADGITLTQKLVVTVRAQAPNVINSFDTQEESEASGWKGASASKGGSQVNDLTWHETYQGKQGVLQLLGTKNSQYRNFYFDASSYWTKTSLNTYLTENDASNWDNVTIVLWVAGTAGNTVELFMDSYKQTVNVGEWVEMQIPKAYFIDNASAHKTLAEMAADFFDSNEYLFAVKTSDTTDATNVTVYVDGIYLNRDFAGTLSVAATNGGEPVINGEVTITANIATENAAYTFTVIDPDGEETQLGTLTKFTPTKSGAYTLLVQRRDAWSSPLKLTFTVR